LLEHLGRAAEIAMHRGGQMQAGLRVRNGLGGLTQLMPGGRLKLMVAEGSPSVWLTEALVLVELMLATADRGSMVLTLVLIADPTAALAPSEVLVLMMLVERLAPPGR
jgi:hypothetical protein